MISKALELATPSLRDLAGRARLGYHAIRQYRIGNRTLGREGLRRLARVFRTQAKTLEREAAKLDALADRDE